MYLNVDYIHKKGLSLQEVVVLYLIKQNKLENQENNIATYLDDEMLLKFDDLGYLDRVKKKRKSDSDFKILRTTKEANDFLDNCEVPEVTKGDLEMFDYLSKMYLSHEDTDRIIGNKKLVKKYIAIFRNNVGLSLHQMYWLCWLFLDEYKYTKKLENIFFDRNKNRFLGFKNNIEESPLYQYYDENIEDVERFWAKKIKN